MDTTPRAGKRGRSDSLSSTSSASTSHSQASSSRSLSPMNKILRSTSTPREVIECNLPPTCFPTSQTFETTSELERHQLAFHTFICRTPVRDKTVDGAAVDPSAVPLEFSSRKRNEWRECRKIFPDQRILDLHQAETHDPGRHKQHEGIPIFKCFIPPPECTKVFLNPKQRRLHLIDKHKYPRQYYFSITNHGLNRITEQDGLGASLIRPVKYFEPPPSTEVVDVDMDDLTKSMKSLESSLSMIPAQLRRKGKAKGKTGPGKVLEAGIEG